MANLEEVQEEMLLAGRYISRLNSIHFYQNNEGKVGYNLLANRAWEVNGRLPGEWMALGKNEFRIAAKRAFL